jgi:hypothetical protein
MKIYYYIRFVQRNTISRIVNKVLDFWCTVGIKMKSRFRDTRHSLSLDNSLSPTKGKGPLEERQVPLLMLLLAHARRNVHLVRGYDVRFT